MSMTLYHGEPNGPSFTLLAALAETGLTAKTVAIDLNRGERHTRKELAGDEIAMSVEGEGPVLVSNGEAMADSVFLARFFDEAAGGKGLIPADAYARWQMMMWCRQIIERVAPAAAYLGLKATSPLSNLSDAEYAAATDAIISPDLKARWDDVRNGAFDDDKLADSRAKIVEAVQKIEGQLDGRDWLMGDFSLADLETYAWIAGMTTIVPDAFANAPRTAAWLDRLAARPSVKTALSASVSGNPRAAWSVGPEINRWG